MIVHSTSHHPGAAPSDPTDRSDCSDTERRDATPGEGDPLRQLFHRHANHLNSAQTRRIQARLRNRLFAEDSELG